MKRRIQIGMLAAMATALVAGPHEAAPPRQTATKMSAARAPERPRRGRPRKFSRPSRAVTLTLPEDVIAALQGIDGDLSRAVVRVVQSVAPSASRATVEVATCGDQTVIVVPCSPVLKARTGVELVPLADGGALIAFDERVSVPELELRVGDALADPAIDPRDRPMFEQLAEILRQGRQADGIVLREHRILVVQRTSRGDEGTATRSPRSGRTMPRRSVA